MGAFKKLIAAMKEVKSGNLVVDLFDAEKDEIGQVTRYFTDMITEVKRVVLDVYSSAGNVNNIAGNVSHSSKQLNSTIEQISLSSKHLACGATNQATNISQGVDNMNGLSDCISRVEENIESVINVVADSKNLSQNALEVVYHLNKRTEESDKASRKIVEDINSLMQDMSDIKTIIKIIATIAEKTNLLSLNASIEAAKAGEAGKGFGVVAQEVKKLAYQSKEASKKINNILSVIQEKTQQTVYTANIVGEAIKQQKFAVNETDKSFKTIYMCMDGIKQRMDGIETAAEEMLVFRDSSINTMQMISSVSEDTVAMSEELAASAYDQMSGSEELAKLSKEMYIMAQRLSDAVAIFKV